MDAKQFASAVATLQAQLKTASDELDKIDTEMGKLDTRRRSAASTVGHVQHTLAGMLNRFKPTAATAGDARDEAEDREANGMTLAEKVSRWATRPKTA